MEGIDYNESFSPVSSKDSLKIIMAPVAHINLELHHIYVKMAFLNGDLHKDVYMAQPEGFVVHKIKNIYGANSRSQFVV